VKGEGVPDVGEVWGVEIGLSLGSGKVKTLPHRATLHRRTTTTYILKRPSSRQTLSEIVKKFGTFPFSLRQLEDEKSAKVGVVECVRGGVLRQYEPAGDADSAPVSRLLTTIAITKNGITRLAAPNPPDLSKFQTDKKIEDEEILKILERPLARNTGNKNKKKKKPTKDSKDEE
jgi:methionyl aminopeptidase